MAASYLSITTKMTIQLTIRNSQFSANMAKQTTTRQNPIINLPWISTQNSNHRNKHIYVSEKIYKLNFAKLSS